MSNEIIPFSDLGIVPINDASFNSISSQTFLPRIMLMQSGSEAVKQDKIKQGHFAVVADKENPQDIGDTFDALVLTNRAKALRLEGNEVVEDIYNPEDPSFKKIVADSAVKTEGISLMYGPEFLVYLIAEKKYATFFFSNPTARREAPIVRGMLGKIVTFKKKAIKSGARSWNGITSFASTAPLAELPDMEEMKKNIATFQNPISKKKELAAPDGRER